MPNIKTLDIGPVGLQPSEVGVEATAAAARRGGAFFNQAAQAEDTLGIRLGSAIRDAGDAAVKYAAHREISAGAATLSQITASKNNEWNQTAARSDGNDPTVAPKFMEGLEPTLNKFRDGFMTEEGQQWAEAHIDRVRQHFTDHTAATMSTLAGQAVQTNVLKTVNNLGSTVYNDPSALATSADLFNGSLTGMVRSSPTMTGETAGKVTTELRQKGMEHLVRSAIMGSIAKGGDWQRIANDPTYKEYVNQAETEQFAKAARREERRDLLDRRALETYDRTQKTREADTALSKNFTDNVTFDDNGHATIAPGYYKNISKIEAQYPGLVTPRSEAMVNFGQHQQQQKKENIVTDPTALTDLYSGIFRSDKPITDVDIYKAATEKKLDAHDTANLIKLYNAYEGGLPKDPVFRAKIEAAKEALGVNIVGDGHNRFASFIQSFLPEYLRQKNAGTLDANVLNINDKNSLIGKWIESYAPSPDERMMGRILKNLQIQNVNDLSGIIGTLKGTDKPAPGAAPAKVPASLGGIADLTWSKERGLFYDRASGQAYYPNGNPVK